MNKRIKSIRNKLNLNQEEFASRLGFNSKGTISALENGARDITDRVIKQICIEFNVNEKWLKTGKGKMFKETSESIISELTETFDLNELDQKLIMEYSRLDKEQRQTVKRFMETVLKKEDEEIEEKKRKSIPRIGAETPVYNEKMIPSQEAIDEALALELEAEKKGKTSTA